MDEISEADAYDEELVDYETASMGDLSYATNLLGDDPDAESPYITMDRHIAEATAAFEDTEIRLSILEDQVRQLWAAMGLTPEQ